MLKLSVITINFNNATGLRLSIESLIKQTFIDYEYIIIDGGSTDESKEIIKEYSEKLSYWVSEKDKGIYHAMNKGIAQARGEYCFFLNSGDFLADNKVLKAIFAQKPTEDVLFGNLLVGINGKVIGKAFGKEILSFADVYAHTIKHQASFIKRCLFDQFGMYNESRKIIADWEFFIKAIGVGNASYQYFNTYISFFDNEGISNRMEKTVSDERKKVVEENIPVMMQSDYEFLLKYKKYEGLFNNNFAFILIRLLNRIFFWR